MKTGAIALKDDDKSDDEEDEMSQKESSKLFQIDLKGQNVFHKYAWEGDLKEMQNTVTHIQKIKSESFCKECFQPYISTYFQIFYDFLSWKSENMGSNNRKCWMHAIIAAAHHFTIP